MLKFLSRSQRYVVRTGLVLLASTQLYALPLSSAYAADTWPQKNISVVVPFAAGGVTDIIGRMLADGLAKEHPETNVVVENIVGGASIPAVLSVMRDGGSGSKIIMASDTPLFINQHAFTKQSYNPEKDLAGVTMLYRTPHSFSINASSEHKTFDDFVNHIKQNPGKVMVGINVIGGVAHLGLERWKKANNLDFEIVPYKGGGVQAVADLIGDHIHAHVDVLGNAIPFAAGGKTKILAVLQNTKFDDLPGAEPQDEKNPLDLTVPSVLVLAVNGETSKEKIDSIYASIKKVTEQGDFAEKMKDLKFELVVSTPEETKQMRDQLAKEIKAMYEVSGLTPN